MRCGAIEEAGFPPASFDRVLTSLVLHHLTTEEKVSALRTVRRLLRPNGELHVADIGPPHNALMRIVSLPLRGWASHRGDDRIGANLSGRMPALMREAGFATVAEEGNAMMPIGTLTYWKATV
ncbi:MAG: methyltransferase domain-containing protein [Streptosporangiales bacterium]|nr:methyltransferase domain-containing protein [Streptosporangiales bacterium]